MRVRWAVLVFLLFGLSACGSTSSQHLTLPAAPGTHQGIAMNALLTGRLSGRADPGQGRACVWIGSGAQRTILLWPSGYVAEEDPLRVLNPSGRVVAQVGSHVDLGGGGATITPQNAGLQACGSPTPSHGWIVTPTSSG